MATESGVQTSGVFHVAIIKGVDQTIERFWKDLGVGPWQVMTLFESGQEKLTLHGKPISLPVKAAITQVGDLMIAVDEPLSRPNPYEEILDRRGGGAHHLAFVVDDLPGAAAEMERMGYTEITSAYGIGPDGDGAGSYFDTVDAMGTTIELAKLPREMPPPESVYPPQSASQGGGNLAIKGGVHVALAVRDAEAAARRYSEDLGVGPWEIMTFGPDVERATYRGKPVNASMKVAAAKVGPVVIALEQPLSAPSPLQDFLDRNGQGIHHICLAVDDLEVASKEMQRLGYEETFAAYGFGPNKDGEAAYFDTEATFGVVIELAKVPSGEAYS